MNAEIKAKVKAHALNDAPNEACGFVCVNNLGECIVIPTKNVSRNTRQSFVIDPKEYLAAMRVGEIVAYYHSHVDDFIRPQNEQFSKEDLDISYESCLPALLYVHPNDTWNFHLPFTYEPAPLLGRPFVWGVWDCYTLVRDYHLTKRGIQLGCYFAPDNATNNTDFGYEKYVKEAKLKEVQLNEITEGDIILFSIKSDFINHSVVYLDGNEFLHQPVNKISSKGLLDDRFLKYIKGVYRYHD